MRSLFTAFFAGLSPRARAIMGLSLALHIAFSLFFVIAIPLHGGPDESAHFAYVRQLVDEHSLPVLTDPRATRDARTGAIAHHPPLNYVINAPIFAVSRGLGDQNSERVMRLTAVLWSIMTLLFTWRILRENFPDQLALGLAAFVFAALLPHFLLVSSVLNNDGTIFAFSALFLWKWLRLCRDENATTRDWAILGVLWGLTLLSKSSALLYVAPVFVMLALQMARKKRSVLDSVRAFVAFGVPGVLMSGWWFARFYFMIGRVQPVPELAEYRPILLSGPLDLLFNPNVPLLVGRFVAGAMRSIWGQVDWFLAPEQRDAMNQGYEFWPSLWGPTLPAPALFDLTLMLYRVAVVATLFAFTGLIIRLIKRRFEPTLGLLALWFAFFYAALAGYTLFKHPGFFEGGRYILPGLPAVAALWVWGVGEWLPGRSQKWLAPALLLFFGIWNYGCAVNLAQFLVPFYAPK